MSNIPSDIDSNAIQSASVTGSPDDKELSWSNVEDTDDDTLVSCVAVEPLVEQPVEVQPVEVQPVAEKPVEVQPVTEVQSVAEQPVAEQPVEVQPLAEQPVAEPQEQPLVEPQEVQKSTVPSLTINESDDDMPPLVSSDDESSEESSDESSDDIPQLVESSDESSEDEESDDEMPELVSDDEDIVHMLIRDVDCLRCRTAIQTLLSHDHDSPNRVDEDNTFHPKNEFPPIITHILWLFVTLHALNLLSTWYNM
jgi:hypothetical protein